MKFSHTKTVPRQPKPKLSSQIIAVKPDRGEPERQIKSSSVSVIKKTNQTTSKPTLPFKGKNAAPLEEIKNEVESKKTGLFTTKPSAKFTNIKTIDPFADTTKSKMFSFE